MLDGQSFMTDVLVRMRVAGHRLAKRALEAAREDVEAAQQLLSSTKEAADARAARAAQAERAAQQQAREAKAAAKAANEEVRLLLMTLSSYSSALLAMPSNCRLSQLRANVHHMSFISRFTSLLQGENDG